jgi:thiol-disulfide isomerase/thioredoxin
MAIQYKLFEGGKTSNKKEKSKKSNKSKKTNKSVRKTVKKKKGSDKKKTGKKNKTDDNRSIGVLLYAEWCHHCQQLKPEWANLKDSLQDIQFVEIEESSPIKDEQINILEKITNGISIQNNGYPTIFKVQNGTPIYYNGPRTMDNMRDFFTKEQTQIGGFNRSKKRRNSLSKKNKN